MSSKWFPKVAKAWQDVVKEVVWAWADLSHFQYHFLFLIIALVECLLIVGNICDSS